MINQLQELKDLLKGLPSPLYFLPNPGNAGDCLIASATHQFFQKNDIEYITVLDANFSAEGKNVIYAGGGNFGGDGSRVAKNLKAYANEADTFILLPHTLFGAKHLLSKLPETAHLFCREQVSYEHARKCVTKAKVYLTDDMVINADLAPFLIKPNSVVSRETIKEVVRRLTGNSDYDLGIALSGIPKFISIRLKQLFGKPKSGKVLHAFRNDVEKTDIDIPADNVDISDVYELSSCQPELSALGTYRFLDHINRFDEVHTNRLHVAIGAMKLGKQVKLYGNNYFKIRAIYDYSIKGKVDNVEWCE